MGEPSREAAQEKAGPRRWAEASGHVVQQPVKGRVSGSGAWTSFCGWWGSREGGAQDSQVILNVL